MSFSGDVKAEMCKVSVQKQCCAKAELYGILIFASAFSLREVRIITGNSKLQRRITQLCAMLAAPITLDFSVTEAADGRRTLLLTDREQIRALMRLFDYDEAGFLNLHLNGWLLEEDCCRYAFLRGAYLTGGYLSEPEKLYYLELSTTHGALVRELAVLVSEMGLRMKTSRRKDNYILYCKDSETLENYLTMCGAHKAVIAFMETRVIKDVRNKINRRVNCEASNIMKAAENGSNQLQMMRRIRKAGLENTLDEKLREAMRLRMEYPDETLAELAARTEPPVSKSGLNHRLNKLVAMAEQLPEAEDEEEPTDND